MSSLLPGFSYDVFVSYRHNDNRSGWVTEFVKSLQEELAATIKEPVSVYFDTNSHDGLLETHLVDKSLEGKLKCLILVPILSQTYCDPKSFAWQHEFCSFNKLVKDGPLGRDIQLLNGNVASRILPVKIHDLSAKDMATLEHELGGPVRSVDFIYKSPGVNRPLRQHEESNENQNKTHYRNQINKVANAIRELLESLQEPVSVSSEFPTRKELRKTSSLSKKFAVGAAIVLLAILGYFAFTLLTKRNTPTIAASETTAKSLAVLPFIDLSPDKDQKWFSDGLTEDLINRLAQFQDLRLIARTSSFAFEGTNLSIQTIADSLHVQHIVEGSVRKSGNRIKVTAQMIRASDGTHLWSETYERDMKDVFLVQDDISGKIASVLNIILDEKENMRMAQTGTRNVNAYEAFQKGLAIIREAHSIPNFDMLWKANEYFRTAARYDPNFAMAWFYQEDVYSHYLLNDVKHMDTLTEETAYRMIQQTLSRGIELSKDPTEKNYYTIEKVFLSNDWTQLPTLVDQFARDPKASSIFALTGFGWVGKAFNVVGRGDDLFRLIQHSLQRDPLLPSLWRRGAESLLSEGKVAEAKSFLDKCPLGVPAGMKYYFFIDKLPDSTGFSKLPKGDNLTSRVAFYRVVALYKTGQSREADALLEALEKNNPFDAGLVYCYQEIGQVEKANRKARAIDNLSLPAFRFEYMYPYHGGKRPFDLNQTPNYKKRLMEAGAFSQ